MKKQIKAMLEIIYYITQIAVSFIMLYPQLINAIKNMPFYSVTENVITEAKPSSLIIKFNKFVNSNYKYILVLFFAFMLFSISKYINRKRFFPAIITALITIGLCIYFVVPEENRANETPQVIQCEDLFLDNKNKYSDINNEKINNYIEKSYQEDLSIKELDSLTDFELYLIRNGIYAYSGRIFDEDYYEMFPWYNGRISEKNFSWDMLNKYQQNNIKSILHIEEQRKNENL